MPARRFRTYEYDYYLMILASVEYWFCLMPRFYVLGLSALRYAPLVLHIISI